MFAYAQTGSLMALIIYIFLWMTFSLASGGFSFLLIEGSRIGIFSESFSIPNIISLLLLSVATCLAL